MPSNWLYIDTNFPTFTGEESPNDKITTIQNYLFMLVEQLRYTLHNLDTANMNLTALEEYSKGLTEPIYLQIGDLSGHVLGRMEDAEGNITMLQQTATAITSWATNAQGDISMLQQTATAITSRVEQVRTELDGKIRVNASEIEQTAQAITSRVTSVETDLTGKIEANSSEIKQTATAITSRVEEVTMDLTGKIEANTSEIRQTAKDITATIISTQGDVSVLQQTAASLTSRVSDAEGGISSLQQTATSITSRVANAEKNVSTLQQTATAITSRVTNTEKSVSTLQQTASSLSAEIKNVDGDLSKLTQKVDGFKLEVTNGPTTSTIKLKSGSTSISSQEIKMTGFVTFTGLSGGTTTIDGACIKTGTVAAKYIDADVIRTGNLKDGKTIISGANIQTGTIAAKYIDADIIRAKDLSGGTTTISGACIKTGTISADRIDVDKLKVKRIYGSDGIAISAETRGTVVIGANTSGWSSLSTVKISARDVVIGSGTYGVTITGPSIVPDTNTTTVANLGDTTHCWGGGYFKALHTNTSGLTILGSGERLGFFGTSPVTKRTVSNSGSVESVVGNLVTALKAYGLI